MLPLIIENASTISSVSKCRCDLFQLLETSWRNETLLLWFLLLGNTFVSTFLFSEKKHNTVDARTPWMLAGYIPWHSDSYIGCTYSHGKYRSDFTLGCSAATAWTLEFGANKIQRFVLLLVCNLRQKDDRCNVKAVRCAGFCVSVGWTCLYEL